MFHSTAVDVAVIVSNNWTQLKNDGKGVWRASVETGEGGRQLKLSAKIDKKGNNYATLLSYIVRARLTSLKFIYRQTDSLLAVMLPASLRAAHVDMSAKCKVQ